MKDREKFMEVKDLVVEYHAEPSNVRAVDGVSFDLFEGEVLGLVGESGCGKSTLGFSLLGLLKGGEIKKGQILFNDTDLALMSEKELRKKRGKDLSMIFQASQNVLNPTQKIYTHFKDTLEAHNEWNEESEERIRRILERLEISPERINDYALQFSGGMRQRIVIGLSLILNPQLLIADEPTTALDVLVQARILQLLSELKEEFKLTMVLISHDLGVIAENSTRIAVMYAGQIVEIAKADDIFENPQHPYTEALINAIPDIHQRDKIIQESIPGSPPDLKNPPDGCRFADRCEYEQDFCSETMVELVMIDDSTQARCLKYYDEYREEFE